METSGIAKLVESINVEKVVAVEAIKNDYYGADETALQDETPDPAWLSVRTFHRYWLSVQAVVKGKVDGVTTTNWVEHLKTMRSTLRGSKANEISGNQRGKFSPEEAKKDFFTMVAYIVSLGTDIIMDDTSQKAISEWIVGSNDAWIIYAEFKGHTVTIGTWMRDILMKAMESSTELLEHKNAKRPNWWWEMAAMIKLAIAWKAWIARIKTKTEVTVAQAGSEDNAKVFYIPVTIAFPDDQSADADLKGLSFERKEYPNRVTTLTLATWKDFVVVALAKAARMGCYSMAKNVRLRLFPLRALKDARERKIEAGSGKVPTKDEFLKMISGVGAKSKN